MLPPDQEIVTFMEKDYENKRDRYLVAKNAFMDDYGRYHGYIAINPTWF